MGSVVYYNITVIMVKNWTLLVCHLITYRNEVYAITIVEIERIIMI